MQVERDEPVIQDQALGELSQMFLSNPSDPTPGGEALDVSRFDFTMESLGAMDGGNPSKCRALAFPRPRLAHHVHHLPGDGITASNGVSAPSIPPPPLIAVE